MSGGVPPSSRAKTRASISNNPDVKKAARLYERFSGHEAEGIGRIKVKALPKVGVAIGTIDGIMYTTIRDGREEKYIHQFRAKDKPIFVVSPDGKQLFMIGGAYDFTERGIVDRSDVKNRRRK
jgi:hypothetical protein